MKDELRSLIEILKDKRSEHGDRLDAASYLEEYEDDEAEITLCDICLDKSEDEDIVETSSESLGGIWSKKGRVNSAVYHLLPRSPRLFVDAIIAQRNAVLSRELGIENSP